MKLSSLGPNICELFAKNSQRFKKICDFLAELIRKY